jgi:asparagine synthase (glutamine-hydrolysing)
VHRDKFAFNANASPELIQLNESWVDHYLSPSRIRKAGYFDSGFVQELRRKYADRESGLDLLYEDDLLMTVITHGIFLEAFDMPDLS